MRKEPPLLQARREERLEAILDSIADGIVVTDAQRQIVSLHGSLYGLSGSLGWVGSSTAMNAVLSYNLAQSNFLPFLARFSRFDLILTIF